MLESPFDSPVIRVQADAQAAAENAVKFQSLASAQTTHKGELDACAASQREGSAALLGAVQATIAQVGSATSPQKCGMTVNGTASCLYRWEQRGCSRPL